MDNLFKKYDIAAPRYTSYPPVPFWSRTPAQNQWLSSINNDLGTDNRVDLYLHIPYCESLCWYCGCHRTITKNKDKADIYSDYLLKEWSIYLENLNRFEVNSIHFGGGTPTFLKPSALDKLLLEISKKFSPTIIGAIEVDPRTCKVEHLNILQKYGFKRISMGIQDFNNDVQESINRLQSLEMVKQLIKEVRSRGFESLNFDLIYGLPKQTIDTISETIDIVKTLGPDLVAFYSYAHLPESLKNQKLIKEDELPSGSQKRELYELGKKLLLKSGYIEIGLDHFAKENSYLANSYLSGKLNRTFMGYTDKKSKVMLGLGVSSISNTTDTYMQNLKSEKEYKEHLDSNLLPIFKGHRLTSDEVNTQEAITKLMCNGELAMDKIEKLPYQNEIKKELQVMEGDQLVQLSEKNLKLTDFGHKFMRNVAMSLDFHIREKKNKVRFSRTI